MPAVAAVVKEIVQPHENNVYDRLEVNNLRVYIHAILHICTYTYKIVREQSTHTSLFT
jgi:hypothetical protein